MVNYSGIRYGLSTPFFYFFTLILLYCDRWGISKGIYCCLLPYCIWLRGSHCNAGIRRGKAISEFRKPEGPPPAPPPSWARKEVLHLRCVTQLTLVCILRYSGCSSLPIQSSVCYDIQNGSLCRSGFLHATLSKCFPSPI